MQRQEKCTAPFYEFLTLCEKCPYFPAFGMRFSVSLRIQPECGKMRAKKTPNKNTFHDVSKIQWGAFRVAGFTSTSMYIISNILMLLFSITVTFFLFQKKNWFWSFICMLEIRFCPYGCDALKIIFGKQKSFLRFLSQNGFHFPSLSSKKK